MLKHPAYRRLQAATAHLPPCPGGSREPHPGAKMAPPPRPEKLQEPRGDSS